MEEQPVDMPVEEAPAAEPVAAEPAEATVAEPAEATHSAADEIIARHGEHAAAHGLIPGGDYALSTHNDPQVIEGALVGTNDLGVLFHALGSRFLSFHPWASIKALVHKG